MKTKTRSLLVIIVMLIATSAFAQQAKRKPPSIEKRVSNVIAIIEKKVEINESQKSTIEDAFTVFFTKADKQKKPGVQPEKSIIDGLEKERDNRIKKVLSQEQYEDYLKVSCQLRPRPKQQGQRQKPPKQN